MTHYTIAVGPMMPGRADRIVAIIGQTPDDSFFRRAATDMDVLRIAAECGVNRAAVQWLPEDPTGSDHFRPAGPRSAPR